MRLIQISSPNCYWCVIGKQYIGLKIKEHYTYLDISKKEDLEIVNKNFKNKSRSFPQFFLLNDKGEIIEEWIGWNESKAIKMIEKIREFNRLKKRELDNDYERID